MTTTTKDTDTENTNQKTAEAQLVRPDTALSAFRDGGYSFADAVGECIDNSIQAGATTVQLDWTPVEGSNEVSAFAIHDDGRGIPEDILADVLTVGFSTRYEDRNGIGRFGVGFKLGTLSQAKRLEIYTRPEFLSAESHENEDGYERWTYSEDNTEGQLFRTVLDMDKIESGNQKAYVAEEVDSFPDDFAHLDDGGTGTLIVWRKLDRMNEERAYAKNAQEKLAQLTQFLRRAYREYIDGGVSIYLGDDDEPLYPYDPQFQLDDPIAEKLANGQDMTGELVEEGTIEIDDETVEWSVYLTPKVTRLEKGGGGVEGPDGENQFKQLYIPDNEGKLSFLRHNREISYTIVPKLLPSGVKSLDRHIGITVEFPPTLDEYFQVKHVKRGVEPVDKFRDRLRNELRKPVKTARTRIRRVWRSTKEEKEADEKDEDEFSGGRQDSEAVAKTASDKLPLGRAGLDISPEQEKAYLKRVADDLSITDEEKQERFIQNLRQKPIAAIDAGWPGKGLVDIEHLNKTVVLRINNRHPLIEQLYDPIRKALQEGPDNLSQYDTAELLEKARDAVDLLLFAYAKAENMSKKPDKNYGPLREFLGQFTGVYVEKRDDIKSE